MATRENDRRKAVKRQVMAICRLLVAMVFFSFKADGALIRAVDRDALLAFKAGITSDPMGILTTWSPGFDCANEKRWLGVYCQGSIVTKVLLADLGLRGTISPSIGKLTSLVSLRLNKNKFHGKIPTALNLPFLSELYLSHNQLDGTIPTSITKLKNLSFLALNNNFLTGYIPSFIGDLTMLRLLDLHGNKLGGSIPASITKLINLSVLSLYSNGFSGNLPTNLGDLRSLNYLYLQRNQLRGDIPASIGSIKYLQRVDLGFNKLWGGIPPSMASLKFLNELSLESNLLGGTIPLALGSLPLNTLNLKNNLFIGYFKLSLSNCQSFYFRGIDISGNYFTKTEISCNSKPICPSLVDNCMAGNYFPKNCPYARQRSNSSCFGFCNALQTGGACGGHGVCNLPGSGIAYCRCNPGYYRKAPAHYTCILIPPKRPRK